MKTKTKSVGMIVMLFMLALRPEILCAQNSIPVEAHAITNSQSGGTITGNYLVTLQDTTDAQEIQIMLGVFDGCL